VYSVGEKLAISDRFKDHPNKDFLVEAYILLWVAVLVAMSAINPGDHVVAKVFAGIAIYRWCEVFATVLGFAIGATSYRGPRTLVVAGIYALQITLVFAILDHAFARGGFVGTSHAFDYLYVSWTDMTTLGAVKATSDAAHAMTIATVSSGLFLLAILVARAVNDLGAVEHMASHREIDNRLNESKEEIDDRLNEIHEEIDERLRKKGL
jgi:hypothetical protein